MGIVGNTGCADLSDVPIDYPAVAFAEDAARA